MPPKASTKNVDKPQIEKKTRGSKTLAKQKQESTVATPTPSYSNISASTPLKRFRPSDSRLDASNISTAMETNVSINSMNRTTAVVNTAAVNTSFYSKSQRKPLLTKYKSTANDPETILKPFKDYRTLQEEIVKLFTQVPALNAHIDQQWNLVITTFSKADDEKVKSINIPEGAFNNAKFERIVKTNKYFFAIKNVETDIDLDSTHYKDILKNEYGIIETKRRDHRNQTYDPKKHRH